MEKKNKIRVALDCMLIFKGITMKHKGAVGIIFLNDLGTLIPFSGSKSSCSTEAMFYQVFVKTVFLVTKGVPHQMTDNHHHLGANADRGA